MLVVAQKLYIQIRMHIMHTFDDDANMSVM